MNKPLFIGIDIGTQGTKTVLCEAGGKVVAEAFCPSVLEHPEKGAVCEDPARILNSAISTIKETVEKSGVDGKDVRAIGIDAQMAGIMAVDKDFNAVTPLDSWLDNRCAEYTELIEEKMGDYCRMKSGGQVINSHASKILWWKNKNPEIYAKICKFVMPNGYVAGKLCGLSGKEAFMDYTFLHFNCFSDNLALCFDDKALSKFGVDKNKLPLINSPETVIGHLTKEYAAACGLSVDTAVISGCGDTAASSLGAGITEKGMAYDVAGTASVFACCTDEFVPDVKCKTLMFSRSVVKGLFLPLAYVTGGGLRLKWFADLVKSDLKTLDNKAAEVPIGSSGVIFVPHFSGRACPLDNNMTGMFANLTDDIGEGEMYRSILEAIAFEYKGYLNIMKELGCIGKISAVRGVGGGAKSPIFAKIKADVLAIDYLSAEHICSAPVAMAKLAAHSLGYLEGSLSDIFSNSNGKMVKFDEENQEEYRQAFERYYDIVG